MTRKLFAWLLFSVAACCRTDIQGVWLTHRDFRLCLYHQSSIGYVAGLDLLQLPPAGGHHLAVWVDERGRLCTQNLLPRNKS